MTDLYQSQRAMRNMRRAAMQRGVIAILDVGTSKIACLILRFDGSRPAARQDGRRADGRASRRSG
jgi:cell division protein FtsA